MIAYIRDDRLDFESRKGTPDLLQELEDRVLSTADRDQPAWLEPRKLVRCGIILVTIQLMVMAASAAYAHSLSAAAAAGNASPETLKEWAEFSRDIAIPNAALLRRPSLAERNPALFWKGVSCILGLALFLLILATIVIAVAYTT